ncbi:MAG: hypothetical protein ACKVQB_03220 [Bacteroidia bacterium]
MVLVSLIDSIPELLYKQNCVIIPGFGGFITNFKHSGFEESRNVISPSCKKVAFNQSLIENDGLLANSWAQTKGITYKSALEDVASFSEFLKERIFLNKSFDFKNIGTFYLSTENKIIFVPYLGHNFLESSFGLYPVKIKPLHVQPAISFTQNEANTEFPEVEIKVKTVEYKPTGKIINFKNPLLLKVASFVFLATVSAFSVYYLINNKHQTTTQYQPENEQHASIIHIDSNIEKSAKKVKIDLEDLEYNAERKKLTEIKTQLDSFSESNSPKQETFNVVIGYYPSEAIASKILKGLTNDYSNAVLSDNTSEGYSIIVETFYKHTTANTFSVMLIQNGYKNVKIEKQVVFGK